jgi:hypothetical protein
MAILIIKVNLLGNISGLVKHTARQKHTVKVADNEYVGKIIIHTDREPVPCSRSIRISEEIVNQWLYGKAPEWEDERNWKRLSVHQKIASYVVGFDEGYGVTYDFVH